MLETNFFFPQPKPNNQNCNFLSDTRSKKEEKKYCIERWKYKTLRNKLAMKLMMDNFEKRLEGKIIKSIEEGVWEEVNQQYPLNH